MTFVVTDNCIACKYTDCVDSCPVDCFHEGENMLVINAAECIDCGVCVPECPADAISPDTAEGMQPWVEFNARYTKVWPIIFSTQEPLSDADEFDGEENKLENRFSDKPAEQAA